LLRFRLYTDTAVGDVKTDQGAFGRITNPDETLVRKFEGVGNQVGENLSQLGLVGAEHGVVVIKGFFHLKQKAPFFGLCTKNRLQIVQNAVDIDGLVNRFHLLFFQRRDGDDVVDNTQELIGTVLNDTDVAVAFLRIQVGKRQQLGEAANGIHGGTDLVGNVLQESRFEPAAFFCFFFGHTQCLFVFF